MGISYLPGAGELIGPALSELVKGVNTRIDPNFDFRKTMERALASNPQLLQQLADLEFSSPGAITGAFGDVLSPTARGALSSTKPTAEAISNRAIAEATPGIAGMKPGEFPEELSVAQQGAVRNLTGVRPGELVKESLEGANRRRLMQYFGTLSPERQAQLGAYDAMPALMNDEHFLKSLELQERMFNARKSDRISDSISRLRESNAIWWQQHVGIGTSEEWKDYFSEPGRRRLEALKTKGSTNLTSEDQRLLDIHEAFEQAPAERRAMVLNRIDLGIRNGIKAVKASEKDSERAALLSGLNTLLEERSRVTGKRFEARYDAPERTKGLPIIGGMFKALRFYNEEGEEIDPSVIEADLPAARPRTRTATPNTPAAAAPEVLERKRVRFNQLASEMFPGVTNLSQQQVAAVQARVEAEVK